jgi:hypothetical protein
VGKNQVTLSLEELFDLEDAHAAFVGRTTGAKVLANTDHVLAAKRRRKYAPSKRMMKLRTIKPLVDKKAKGKV